MDCVAENTKSMGKVRGLRKEILQRKKRVDQRTVALLVVLGLETGIGKVGQNVVDQGNQVINSLRRQSREW